MCDCDSFRPAQWGYFWNDDPSKWVYALLLDTPSLTRPFYIAVNFNVYWKNFSKEKPI